MKRKLLIIIIGVIMAAFLRCKGKDENSNIYMNKNYDIITTDSDTLTLYSRICIQPYKIAKFKDSIYKIESSYWGSKPCYEENSPYHLKLLIEKKDNFIEIRSKDSCYIKSELSKYNRFEKIINPKFDFNWDKLDVSIYDEFGDKRAYSVFEIEEIPKHELKKLYIISQKGFSNVITEGNYTYATFKFYKGKEFKHIVKLPMLPCWLDYFSWRNAKFKKGGSQIDLPIFIPHDYKR